VEKLSSLQEMILNNPTLFGVFGIDYEKLQASDSDQITRIRLMMALDQPLYEHLDRHIQTLLSHQNLLNQEGELKALSVQEVCQLITQARGNPSVPQTACGIADCSVRESIVVSTEQGKGF
jgi:hypothetical protein